MRSDLQHPIAAICSPVGPALRSVVRVCGLRTVEIVSRCFQPLDPAGWMRPGAARLHAGQLTLPGIRCPVSALVALWPGQRSFTGQPTAELHLPGSPPLVEALLEALYAAGARPAQPGEFTLRAFLSGRLDLAQAEAVLGVIDAETPAQLATALNQLAGGLSRPLGQLRENLLLHLADLEAGLDFVEEDIEFVQRPVLRAQICAALALTESLLTHAQSRTTSSGRTTVVLAGLPNAGKSSLFNALGGSPAAIVSPQPGTTRDVLRRTLHRDDLTFDLLDTAGFDTGRNDIEQQAQQLRAESFRDCQLIVWCTASDLSATDRIRDSELRRELDSEDAEVLQVTTKAELGTDAVHGSEAETVLCVSAHTGAGLAQLLQAIADRLRRTPAHRSELLATTAARCREALRAAAESLTAAKETLDAGGGDELVASELRRGLSALGLVGGGVTTEEVLDRIFTRFCIGK